MSTTLTYYGQIAVLTVKEDLDEDSLETFKRQAETCAKEKHFSLVVDCSHVGGFDSISLETLVDLQDRCEEEYGSVKLCALNETLRKVLEITRLLRRFEVFDDLDSAVRSFS